MTQQGSGAFIISLHDLLARGTTVYWDEAVAIVEEICTVAILASGDHAAVPSLAGARIDADGRVILERDGDGEKSPTAAGRVLHALLANTDVPVPLRLFVTQSTAPETYPSLRAFAEGMAYFGKPDRAALIREVYKRAADLVQAGVEPTLVPAQLPVQEKEPPKKPSQSKKPDVRHAALWSAAVVSIVVAAVAAWAWWNTGAARGATAGEGVLSQAAAAVTDLANQVRERLTPTTSTPAEAPAATPDTSPRPRAKRRGDTASLALTDKTPLAGRAVAIAEADTWQLPVAVTVGTPVAVAASTDTDPSDAGLPAAAAKDFISRDTDRLFTRSDAGVDPPMMQYPQLTPPVKSSSARPPAVNRVEVIVAANGTVERARFVEGPIRMVDAMLLGSVKNWKFTPAVRDGEPVRYQTIVSWPAVP